MLPYNLLNCPICGGSPNMLQTTKCVYSPYFIYCTNCKCSTKTMYDPILAVESWNTRHKIVDINGNKIASI